MSKIFSLNKNNTRQGKSVPSATVQTKFEYLFYQTCTIKFKLYKASLILIYYACYFSSIRKFWEKKQDDYKWID